jgi:hypothetical protein
VYIKLESPGVSYTNNVEPMHKNYKSIGVAYNKTMNLMCNNYNSIDAFYFMYEWGQFEEENMMVFNNKRIEKNLYYNFFLTNFFSYMEHPLKSLLQIAEMFLKKFPNIVMLKSSTKTSTNPNGFQWPPTYSN